jgi:chromosome segregation ATPase
VEWVEQWLDLKKASEITGIQIDALRKRIKAGKIPGRKREEHGKQKWEVQIDAATHSVKVDKSGLKVESPGNFQVDKFQMEFQDPGLKRTQKYVSVIVKEKDQRLLEQSKHISTLERLLSDFQDRTRNLEAEKSHLEAIIKALPAPPETMATRIQEQEAALEEARRREVEIQRETLAKAEEIARLAAERATVEAELARARDDAEKIRQEKETLAVQIEELRRPWWKRWFGIR